MCTPCSCMSLARDSDSDDIFPPNHHLEPVLLHVYDMYKFNDIISNIGLGVFHSGVEIYGTEYAYYGHQYPFSGIYTTIPRETELLASYLHLGDQFQFKQTILIGYSKLGQWEVKKLKKELDRKFQGNKYHLIHNNCNHFSGEFTKLLCEKNIPGWVNRLANVGRRLPFLHKVFPKDVLTPPNANHQ